MTACTTCERCGHYAACAPVNVELGHGLSVQSPMCEACWVEIEGMRAHAEHRAVRPWAENAEIRDVRLGK